MSGIPPLAHLRVVPPFALEAARDVAGFRIGRPLAWFRPETTDDVADVVRLARARGRRVVPVGRATAYWNPLVLDGAYALDVSGLTAVQGGPTDASVATFGAGVLVADVEEALRARGAYLPLHPDAFGTTSIGALVAIGCVAGIGMGLGGIDQWITGLTVVLGTGEVVKTGAANVLGAPPFIRTGMADPTGLFIGSQGSLGIITEVHLRRTTRPLFSHLSAELIGPNEIAPGDSAALRDTTRAVAELGSRSLFDTFRISAVFSGPEAGAKLDAYVVSETGIEELEARVEVLRSVLSARLPGQAFFTRTIARNEPLQRFRPPVQGLDILLTNERLAAVDVLVPHSHLDPAMDIADEVMKEGHALGTHPRTALYTSPDFINLGLHVPTPQGDEQRFHAAMTRWATALHTLPCSPYRWGGVWRPLFDECVDPGYRSLMAGVRSACDPDRVLSGHPMVAASDGAPPIELTPTPSRTAPLVEALESMGAMPAEFSLFDEIVGRSDSGPDTFEYSVSVGSDLARWRLTHYFGVRDMRHRCVEAHTRFLEAAGALGIRVPTSIREYLDQADVSEAVQVAIGIDARLKSSETRLKYYLICDQQGGAPCEPLRAAAGIEIPSRLTAVRTHILGLDFRRDGLYDMKVYHALDVGQLHRIFRNPSAHRATIDGAREVVLHECVGAERPRKLHVAFGETKDIERLIASELGEIAGTRPMLAHIAALNAHDGVDIFPWILARSYQDGALEKRPYTVYFHPRDPRRADAD